MRTLVALVVLLVLLGGLVVVAELVVHQQVEATVQRTAERELGALAGPGEDFETVETAVEGYALLGLLRSRFDAVTLTATDGVVAGIPVEEMRAVARGPSPDAREVESLEVTLRADAARAVAVQLDDDVVAAVDSSAEVVDGNRLRTVVPFEAPVIGAVEVDVEVELRAEDGGLVVEPVSASDADLGLELDLSEVDVLPSYGIAAEELPGGLRVRDVRLEEAADGRALVVLSLGCEAATDGRCALR